MIIEKAYAKINLTLNVLGKRSDGYHEIESVMVPLELYDEITIEKADTTKIIGMELNMENNLMYKAVKLFEKTYNILCNVTISIKKNIPLQAGLAGGSADASAVLRGLNRLYATNISLDELATLSSKLGSDTIFCMYNEQALVKGRGEQVVFLEDKINCYHIVLIKPCFGVSTKDIFDNYKGNHFKNKTSLLQAISQKELPRIKNFIFNDLEETTTQLYPELLNLKKEIEKQDYDVFMTGSGPTLFIISEENININLPNNIQIIKTKIKK